MVNRTDLVEHFVTFVEDKDLNVPKSKLLLSNKCIQTARGCHDDVRMRLLAGKNLEILLHWSATVEDGSLHLRHVFAETSVLVLDLIRQLSGMAHHQDRTLAGNRLDLLQSREDEHCSLSKT